MKVLQARSLLALCNPESYKASCEFWRKVEKEILGKKECLGDEEWKEILAKWKEYVIERKGKISSYFFKEIFLPYFSKFRKDTEDLSLAEIIVQLAWKEGKPFVNLENLNLSLSDEKFYVIDGVPVICLHKGRFGCWTLVTPVVGIEKFFPPFFFEKAFSCWKINFCYCDFDDLEKFLDKASLSERLEIGLFSDFYSDDFWVSYYEDAVHHEIAKMSRDLNLETSLNFIKSDLNEDHSFYNDWLALKKGIPYLDCSPCSLPSELKCVLDLQREYRCFPVSYHGTYVSLALSRFFSPSEKMNFLAHAKNLHGKLRFGFFVTSAASFEKSLSESFLSHIGASQLLQKSKDIEEQGTLVETLHGSLSEHIDIEKLIDAQDPGVVRFVQGIFTEAISLNATDIHISAQNGYTRIRYRVDGMMVPGPSSLPAHLWKPVISRIKILSGINIGYSPFPQDGKFLLKVGESSYEVRVNTCHTFFGEKAILRLQPKDMKLSKLEDLGIGEHECRIIREFLGGDHGLLILCGPTGSGKTSTLASAICEIDREKWCVVTAEQPVEIVIDGVEQTHVDGQNLTFSGFLPGALRQDPDYLLIGETRDSETAQQVVRMSITGHLVLTTLHTNSASGAPSRLIDMGAEPFLVCESLKAVISQRLLRKLCPHCKVREKISLEEIQEKFQVDGELLGDIGGLWRSSGCSHCRGTGFRGRIAIAEGWKMNKEIRNIILNKNSDSLLIEKEMRKQGSLSLLHKTLQLSAKGVVSYEEAISLRNFE